MNVLCDFGVILQGMVERTRADLQDLWELPHQVLELKRIVQSSAQRIPPLPEGALASPKDSLRQNVKNI